MTILYTYYNQPDAITFLESIGCPAYDIEFVFVDDGSKVPLKLNWPNAKVYRIEEDIPWNMAAANNLAFRHLKGKVLRMDIDHYITPEKVEQLKQIEVGEGQIILFKRQLSSGKKLKDVHNILLLNVDDYWKAGGYDEQFSGNYGYLDTDQKYRFAKMGYEIIRNDMVINVNPVHATKGLSRDMTVNTAKIKAKWGI